MSFEQWVALAFLAAILLGSALAILDEARGRHS